MTKSAATLKTSSEEGLKSKVGSDVNEELQEARPLAAFNKQAQCIAGDYLTWFYTDRLGISRNEDKSDELPQHRLDHYLQLKNLWNDISGCKLNVKKLDDLRDPWEQLRNDLDRDNEMFVYELEPKNLVQRVSDLTRLERMRALDLGGLAHIAGQSAGIGASADSQSTSEFDQIESHSIVLPIGEGASSASGDSPRTISFGWVIAPRIAAGKKLEQIAGTYSLAAMISTPSWWGSLRAHYTMCWVDADQVGALQSPSGAWEAEHIQKLCGQSSQVVPTDTKASDLIRLPNGSNDVSRKLGFELPPSPRLDLDQMHTTLQAGFPGDILLKGDRLWRSTEVLLNTQRADKITVLPDMKGIVAHFNCVLPPIHVHGIAATAGVTVVTSEGTGVHPTGVEIEVLEDPSDQLPSARPAGAATSGEGKQSDQISTTLGQQAAGPVVLNLSVASPSPASAPPSAAQEAANSRSGNPSGSRQNEGSEPGEPEPKSQESPGSNANGQVQSPVDPSRLARATSRILKHCAAVAEIGWKPILSNELKLNSGPENK